MTYLEQLEGWLNGEPKHGDQCVPDFSCCRPELLAPKEVREVFMQAYEADNERVIMRLCMEFLGAAFSGKKVHIAGLEAMRREQS